MRDLSHFPARSPATALSGGPRDGHGPGAERAPSRRAVINPVVRESRAIWTAIASGAAGAAVGLVVFQGRRALSGDESVGTIAAITAASCAGIACLVGLARSTRTTHRWMARRPWGWVVADAFGLLVVHAAIAVMACLALFRLFQEAFTGLTVDRVAATVMLTIISSVAGYLGFNSAARISTRSLSSLLAVFMASGMIVSMLLAENPFWWHAFFSELGTGQAGVLSFWTFNTTLAVSGLVLTTLASFITQDLYTWARARESTGGRRARVAVLRSGLFVVGLCMMGAGVVPINLSDPVHSTFIRILGVVFIALLATIQLWLPGFPAAVYVASYLMVALALVATALWFPLRYYNLTGFELAMGGIVYGWLVVFIRTLDAVLTVAGIGDTEREEAAGAEARALAAREGAGGPTPAGPVPPGGRRGTGRGRGGRGETASAVPPTGAPAGPRPAYRGWRVDPRDPGGRG
ncbi:hypothetical protein E7744_13715 [Citricoccus sp. SGAir0253]|uniref:hypothetical protein n=1 Tax=Citricoccus sp. SGAir0253 TaxID=2567881 RepID=UPI0010CCF7E4|nr:hypothetical protein [Citricoccus sp. SGAir0253]QCU79070.1 hypothetical protein E7744_13715 [Citricoccus sp. SGAir0253]